MIPRLFKLTIGLNELVEFFASVCEQSPKYMRLTRQLTIANYYRMYNSKHVFTIETPIELDLQDRVIMQEKAVKHLIRHFIEKER